MYKFKFYFVFIYSFGTSVSFAQQPKEIILKHISNFEENIHSNPEKSIKAINAATKEALRCKDTFLIAKCYHKISFYNYSIKSQNKSIDNAMISIKCAKLIKNKLILAANYNLLGMIAMDNSQYKKAANYFFSSLEIADSDELKSIKCVAKLNLANLYDIQKDTINAMKYNEEALKLAEKENFEGQLFDIKNNIATLIRNKNPKRAIQYFYDNYRYAKKNSYFHGIQASVINLTTLYIESGNNELIDKIPNLLDELLKISYSESFDQEIQFNVFFNYAAYYNYHKDYQKATLFYFKAKKFISQPNSIEKECNISKAIALNYEKMGDYKNAFKFQVIYQRLNDKLLNKESKKNINELETKYHVEKKDLKIKLLSKDIILQNKKKQIYFILAISISFILGLVLWFSYRKIKTQRIIQHQKELLYVKDKEALLKEKELQIIKSKIDGEEYERNRIAQELHDGVSSKLAIVNHILKDINESTRNEFLSGAIQNLSEIYNEIRTISHNLSKNLFKGKSFVVLISTFLQKFSQTTALEVTCSWFPEEKMEQFSEDIKHNVYRVFQELFSNIAKHAKAKHVFVSLSLIDNDFIIIIEDDGIGYSNNSSGIGLFNTQERIASLSGSFTIEKGIINGTTTTIIIPIT